jgi:hypothetical protein
MIVAWQFIARNARETGPSRRERYDRFSVGNRVIVGEDRSRHGESHRTLRHKGAPHRPLATPPITSHSFQPLKLETLSQ